MCSNNVCVFCNARVRIRNKKYNKAVWKVPCDASLPTRTLRISVARLRDDLLVNILRTPSEQQLVHLAKEISLSLEDITVVPVPLQGLKMKKALLRLLLTSAAAAAAIVANRRRGNEGEEVLSSPDGSESVPAQKTCKNISSTRVGAAHDNSGVGNTDVSTGSCLTLYVTGVLRTSCCRVSVSPLSYSSFLKEGLSRTTVHETCS